MNRDHISSTIFSIVANKPFSHSRTSWLHDYKLRIHREYYLSKWNKRFILFSKYRLVFKYKNSIKFGQQTFNFD